MRFKFTSLVLLLLVLTSCKTDPKVMPSENAGNTAVSEPVNDLPFACDLISENEMLGILDMEVNLEILDGNRNKKNPNSTSCFYKWDDIKYDMSGVMVQLSKNPLPDEIPDYVTKSMNNKRWEGERSYDDPNLVFKYLDFEGLPFPAIYSRDTYKYYFGVNNKYLCSVVFNYPGKEEVLDAWFKEIATKVVKEM